MGSGLTEEQLANVERAVAALDPMSEDQVKAVCAMLNVAYARYEHRAPATRSRRRWPPSPRPPAD